MKNIIFVLNKLEEESAKEFIKKTLEKIPEINPIFVSINGSRVDEVKRYGQLKSLIHQTRPEYLYAIGVFSNNMFLGQGIDLKHDNFKKRLMPISELGIVCNLIPSWGYSYYEQRGMTKIFGEMIRCFLK